MSRCASQLVKALTGAETRDGGAVNGFAQAKPLFSGGLSACVLIHCLADWPGSPLGPAGPVAPAGPAGPGGPAGPAGPRSPQFCITTSLLSSPELISTMQVEGNSGPIQRKPPVELRSTRTVLSGLILMFTLGSRGRLTLPTIVNSPRGMAAVVISISARAVAPHAIGKIVVIVTMARISVANMAFTSCTRSEFYIRSLKAQ